MASHGRLGEAELVVVWQGKAGMARRSEVRLGVVGKGKAG